jgi:flagellar protein FlaI
MNITKSLVSMIDVIMVIARKEIEGKPARRATATTEVFELDRKTKRIPTEEVFSWNPREDKFVFSGHSSLLERHAKKSDVTEEKITRELNRRKTVLEWMVHKDIRRYTDVANAIREYYANPKRVYQKARVGLK